MLMLSVQDIYLSQQATNKQQAITQVAQSLIDAGCVTSAYLPAMLARDELMSTYLGNGIAVPHGTLESQSEIKQTGVKIFQFPQGVDWGEGDIAYAVVGLAACSDAHLALLRQLTSVVMNFPLAQQLWQQQDVQQFYDLLMGNENPQNATALETQSTAVISENPTAQCEQVFTVLTQNGLHTRPAALLVNEAKKYQANIQLQLLDGKNRKVNGKSLMAVISLGVAQGQQLRIMAQGVDAQQAIDALGNLLQRTLAS